MLNSTSVKTRFLVSVAANGIRSILGFVSGLLIARALSPSGYGDLMFLLGSFAAIRGLLDMGASSAFYTFLSRHTQGRRFYVVYLIWTAFQFFITLALVAAIIPASLFEKVWLGHTREIVLIAFLATFMQQQILQTVSQIGESMRKTVKVQLLTLIVAMFYLAIISILLMYDMLTTENVLFTMTLQSALASLCIYWLLRENHEQPSEKNASLDQIIMEYWVYCKPLIVLAVITFFYDFADKWMLQKFGGSAQQGFFQIANQFANAILLATTSIVGIFWKEIAHAWEKRDHVRITMLYRKATRGLVMLSAIAAGLVLPWSEQIVTLLLGPMYAESWPVLAIMLLYPIHLPMGIIGGSTLLAVGQTKKHTLICVVGMLASMPLAYFMLAPIMAGGLALGAWGLAIKLVSLNVVTTNIQAVIIARHSHWKYDWIFQVVGIPIMIALGYLVKFLAGLIWNFDVLSLANLLMPVIFASILYALLVIGVLWMLPWLIGLDKDELRAMVKQLGRQSIFGFNSFWKPK